MNSNNVLLQQELASPHTAKHHQIPAERKVTCIKPAMWSANNSRLDLARLISVGSPAAANVLRRLFEQLKQAIVDEWCALSQKFIDRSINEWRRRLKCVVQQNGRHIKNRFKHLFSRRLYMTFLLQFLHICTLYSFIELLCKLHIYTCVAQYT